MDAPTPGRETLWLADFATIFAHMWYRDFPVQASFRGHARRADWTIHIGVAVRSTADLLGLFTHFESGGRTDAILRDNAGTAIAALEWEWTPLYRVKKRNELDKLKTGCTSGDYKGVRFACLVNYCREGQEAGLLRDIEQRWVGELPPLLLVLVRFQWLGKGKGGRRFTGMAIHGVEGGKATLLREQKARPWEVKGSRWEAEKGGEG